MPLVLTVKKCPIQFELMRLLRKLESLQNTLQNTERHILKRKEWW